MNNIVCALTFSSTNIACLSSLTAGRKEIENLHQDLQ
jgi:hypothetical protein